MKKFLITTFLRQNVYHKHGVFVHTLKVAYNVIKHKDYKMIAAALLHDIGKPFVAFQKPEDLPLNEYSFTDHEEKSYQIIKNWPFVSDYTKTLVRYHYLIRDIKKSKECDYDRYLEKKKIWENLDDEMKEDLKTFLIYDDLGK